MKNEGGALIVSGPDGNELFELTPFSVRRYNGDENMDYELKKAVTDKIREMAAAGQKSGSMTTKPTISEMRPPYIRRVSTSMPWSSVPSGWLRLGAAYMSIR